MVRRRNEEKGGTTSQEMGRVRSGESGKGLGEISWPSQRFPWGGNEDSEVPGRKKGKESGVS